MPSTELSHYDNIMQLQVVDYSMSFLHVQDKIFFQICERLCYLFHSPEVSVLSQGSEGATTNEVLKEIDYEADMFTYSSQTEHVTFKLSNSYC